MDLMGGVGGAMFDYFKILLYQGFVCIKKYVDEICDLVGITSKGSDLACFDKFDMKNSHGEMMFLKIRIMVFKKVQQSKGMSIQ